MSARRRPPTLGTSTAGQWAKVWGCMGGIVALLLVPGILAGDGALVLAAFAGIAGTVAVATIPASIAALTAAVARFVWVWRTNRLRDVMVADYSPPKGMTPFEGGVMWDSRITQADLHAELLHLAAHGTITLSRDDDVVTIARTGQAPSSDPVDAVIVNHLPQTPQNASTLAKGRSVRRLRYHLQNAAARSLISKGLLKRQVWVAPFFAFLFLLTSVAGVFCLWIAIAAVRASGLRPDSVATLAEGLAVVRAEHGGSWPAAFISLWPMLTAVLALPYGLILTAVNLLFRRIYGPPAARTHAYARRWKELVGFRDYLERTELGRVRFELAEGTHPVDRDKVAWMLALGLDLEWLSAIAPRTRDARDPRSARDAT